MTWENCRVCPSFAFEAFQVNCIGPLLERTLRIQVYQHSVKEGGFRRFSNSVITSMLCRSGTTNKNLAALHIGNVQGYQEVLSRSHTSTRRDIWKPVLNMIGKILERSQRTYID